MPIEQLNVVAPGEKTPAAATEQKKYFLGGAGFPLFCFLIFGLAFLLVSLYLKPVAPDIVNEKVKSIFSVYARYVGFVFALLSMIGMYILYGLKKLFRLSKFYWLNPVLAAAAIFPWWFFARQLMYFEKRYTDIGRGAITYLGAPLHWTVIVCLCLCAVWLAIALLLTFLKRDRKKPAAAAS